jgi:hypothetical protein
MKILKITMLIMALATVAYSSDTLEVFKKGIMYDIPTYKAASKNLGMKALGTLVAGEKVLRLQKEKDWYYIEKLDGTKGYTLIEVIQTPLDERISVYDAWPLASDTLEAAKVKIHLKDDSKIYPVTILKSEGNYCFIKRGDGKTGWIWKLRLMYVDDYVYSGGFRFFKSIFSGISTFGTSHWFFAVLTFILFWIVLLLIPGIIISYFMYFVVGKIRWIPNFILIVLTVGVLIGGYVGTFTYLSLLPPYADNSIGFFALIFWAFVFCSSDIYYIRYNRCPKCHHHLGGMSAGESDHKITKTKTTTWLTFNSGRTEKRVKNERFEFWTNYRKCTNCGHQWSISESRTN